MHIRRFEARDAQAVSDVIVTTLRVSNTKDYSREAMEELGLTVRSVHFNRSHYYAKSNTLMLNFTVTVDEVDPHPNWEVDSWRWFSAEEARQMIRPASLAQVFLNGYLDGEYHFETFIPDK